MFLIDCVYWSAVVKVLNYKLCWSACPWSHASSLQCYSGNGWMLWVINWSSGMAFHCILGQLNHIQDQCHTSSSCTSVCLSVFMPVSLFICVYACQSVCVCVSVCRSCVCQSVSLCVSVCRSCVLVGPHHTQDQFLRVSEQFFHVQHWGHHHRPHRHSGCCSCWHSEPAVILDRHRTQTHWSSQGTVRTKNSHCLERPWQTSSHHCPVWLRVNHFH